MMELGSAGGAIAIFEGYMQMSVLYFSKIGA